MNSKITSVNNKLEIIDNKEYVKLLTDLKDKVRSAQIKASLSVNSELIQMYWEIGKEILALQEEQQWGNKFLVFVSKDLKKSFPNMKGFSVRNLQYMRKMVQEYKNIPIAPQLVAQIPWGHIRLLLDTKVSTKTKIWYMQQATKNGWSRNVLAMQIETNLYERSAHSEKLTNFKETLPTTQSDLAQQMLKDPYSFEFLTIDNKAHERVIETALTEKIQKFLLELGEGFAFVGNQYHLDIGGEDFYIDLLFYHLTLRCYVVIELKTGKFKPEYAGKLNFYLSAVDDMLKHESDAPTIGLILCKDNQNNKVAAEYSLRDLNKPIGISRYQLPSIAQIEKELSTIEEEVKYDEKDLYSH